VQQGPEWSDNFAQRNLQITYSDNPGPLETHRVPQTFDVRPGPAPGTGQLEDYPDELWIDWGEVPVGSTASIYWPAVSAIDVLALAEKYYSSSQLSAADAHTVKCTVPGGSTYVPIPYATGPNFAGLFTVDLPPGIKAGTSYTITVRRVSTQRGPQQLAPPPQTQTTIAGAAAPRAAVSNAETTSMRNWRYIVGTFAVRIPVTTPNVMLPAEENTLAIIKWRLSQMQPGNRWIPVLNRWIGLIEGRVRGLGGNPGTIVPSPWGWYGPPPAYGQGRGHGQGSEHGHEATGKVCGVIYDRFGDFDGFLLRTEEGHERHYRSHEAEIESLARYAWLERVVITVVSDEHGPAAPVRIILRRAPPQPERPRA